MRGHRFDQSLIFGVGSRCPYGCARVLVCAPLPLDISVLPDDIQPMPTSFWLICPCLSRMAGTSESMSGVRRLEDWISARDNGEWANYAALHSLIRIGLIRQEMRSILKEQHPAILKSLLSGGVGGIRSADGEIRVKCLHLQTASWLALGHHPGGEWLRAEGLDGACRDGRCVRLNNV